MHQGLSLHRLYKAITIGLSVGAPVLSLIMYSKGMPLAEALLYGVLLVLGAVLIYLFSIRQKTLELAAINSKLESTNLGYAVEQEALRSEIFEVEQQNKTRSRLFASTAHDLRQPLYALKVNASMLEEYPEDAPEIVPDLIQNVSAVISMFDMMFDMSKLTEGFYVIKNQVIDLPEFMKALNSQYGPAAGAREIDLRFHIKAGVVVSDRVMLGRLLGNLISNAIKFTPERGKVLVANRIAKNGTVSFYVYDTGIGISQEDEAMIFEEFYKSPDLKGTNDGFGLGLSIVNQFATLLKITVSLNSIVGRGTRFKVTLPNSQIEVKD